MGCSLSTHPHVLVQVRFADPSGNHLSPAGEYNLRLGVMKELHPDLIATYAGGGGVGEWWLGV